jgi:hypothetical protein
MILRVLVQDDKLCPNSRILSDILPVGSQSGSPNKNVNGHRAATEDLQLQIRPTSPLRCTVLFVVI